MEQLLPQCFLPKTLRNCVIMNLLASGKNAASLKVKSLKFQSHIRTNRFCSVDTRYAFKAKVLDPNATGTQRKTQEVWILTEAGLYRFLQGGKNKLAQKFTDWLWFDVLPSIRQTGQYHATAKATTELKEINGQLESRIEEMVSTYEEAEQEQTESVKKLEKSLKFTQDDLQAANDQVSKLEKDMATLEEQNDSQFDAKWQQKYQKLKDRLKYVNEMMRLEAKIKHDLTEHNEDLSVIGEYLEQTSGTGNITAVLSRLYMGDAHNASDPMLNRNRHIHLRCAAFSILHTMSFYLVKGYYTVYGKTITSTELSDAAKLIMEVEHIQIPVSSTGNWISLYTCLAGIAKKRIRDGTDYSTTMPIAHLYLYAKNLNKWALDILKMPMCVSYEKEIEAFYGQRAVLDFQFDKVDYEDIRSEVETTQPRITDFF